MHAESLDNVLAHLRTRRLVVTSVESRSSLRVGAAFVFTVLPVSAIARLSLFRSLATLVSAGVPLRRALEVATQQCRDRRLSEALRSILSDIEGGNSLSAAMARRPREFSRLFISMIAAGEIGGVLDDVLERLATMLEVDRAMRKRLAAALAYPAIVTTAASALIVFLVVNIVPSFAGLFAEMHVNVPLSTRVMIAIGTQLRSPLFMAALALMAIVMGFGVKVALSQRQCAAAFDRAMLEVPVIGPLLRKSIVSRFARTLGTLLRSGVPLLGALDACEDVVGNALYQRTTHALREKLREGHALTESLERSGLFDPILIQLARVGEETGRLDAMLIRVAEYFEQDIESAIAALGSVLEPFLIIVLGIVVGTIVASVLIPLYSIIGSIK